MKKKLLVGQKLRDLHGQPDGLLLGAIGWAEESCPGSGDSRLAVPVLLVATEQPRDLL